MIPFRLAYTFRLILVRNFRAIHCLAVRSMEIGPRGAGGISSLCLDRAVAMWGSLPRPLCLLRCRNPSPSLRHQSVAPLRQLPSSPQSLVHHRHRLALDVGLSGHVSGQDDLVLIGHRLCVDVLIQALFEALTIRDSGSVKLI